MLQVRSFHCHLTTPGTKTHKIGIHIEAKYNNNRNINRPSREILGFSTAKLNL